MLLALVLPFAACGNPSEDAGDDIIDVGVGTAVPGGVTPSPGQTGSLGTSPGASVSPGAVTDGGGDETSEHTPGDEPATPTPSNMPTDLAAAKKINSDVIGWIKVPNTNINYPILYDKNFKYNDHDIFGNKTGNPGAGSIYTYYDVLTRNITVTGHNMRKAKSMFHGLHQLQNDKSSLKTQKNRIFSITIFDSPYKEWEVWALYETKDNESAETRRNNTAHLSKSSASEIEAWIAGQKSRSEVDLGVSVSADDILMTLVTCGDNYDSPTAESRLYFFLKARNPST